jgi:peroxiredoxin Q/BCP
LDTVVLGISVDKLEAQQKFTDKEKLTYPLLADVEKKTARAYGVLSPRDFAKRVTFVIDKKGVLRKIDTSGKTGENAKAIFDWVKDNLKEK